MKHHKKGLIMTILNRFTVFLLACFLITACGGGSSDSSISSPSNSNATGVDTTAPSSPSNLAVQVLATPQVDLSWTASTDNIGVTGYKIYRDSTLLTSVSVTSYSDASVSSGTTYSYSVVAYDSAGNDSVSSAAISVDVPTVSGPPPSDTTPPTASITNPSGGSTVSGTVNITATATDNVGVIGVQFKIDTTNLGAEDTSAPYSISWDTTGVTDGSHTITTTAKDTAGNLAIVSIGVTVTNAPITDNTAPTTPANLSAVATSSSQINLTWSASTDNIGVMGYNILRGGTFIGTSTSTSYSDTSLIANISYSYTVTAYDAAGNSSSPSNVAQTSTLALSSGNVFYVDWDNGSDTTGDGSATNPWATPMYADDQISSGDTVIVYAKTSGGDVYSNSCSTVIDAKTDNTIWKAAPGEVVWISSTNDHSSSIWSTCGGNSIAVHISAPNITFDGFYVWGMINLNSGADNAIIQNCDLSGGGTYQGFPAVLRTNGNVATPSPPTDWNENLLVRNCKLHDNLPAMNQGVTNDILVLTYGAKNVIIENSEFYNSLNSGIKWKDHPNGMTARYNYFHDLPTGIQGCGQYCDDGPIYTYQNIFVNVGIGVAPEAGALPLRTYNNLFYNNGRDIGYWHGAGQYVEIFNNLQYHTSGQWYQRYDDLWDLNNFLYMDYNQYYSVDNTTTWRISYANRGTSIPQWQSFLDNSGAGPNNGDDNSIEADPNFLNGSGTFSIPSDFKRASYPQNGRGGAWPTVTGAYITGSEQIGPNW